MARSNRLMHIILLYSRFRRVLAFLAVAGTMVVSAGCARHGAKGKPPVISERPPLNVTVRETDTVQEDERGNPLWRIKADRMNMNEKESTALVQGAHVVVFGPNNAVRLNLVCARMVTDVKERRLVASGGIKAEGPETQTRFQADGIVVDINNNEVVATGSVRGSRPIGAFKAAKLEADLKFTQVRLSDPKGVEMILDPSKARQNDK